MVPSVSAARGDVGGSDMLVESVRRAERHAVRSTLARLGPEAPTLCSEWQAADLAAHLVVSEAYRGWPMVVAYRLRRVLPTGVTRRGIRSLQAIGDRQIRAARTKGWDWLLNRLAAGPPSAYSRAGIAEIRLVEEWIHHEDLRRANGMAPRTGTLEVDEALWQAGLALIGYPEFLPGREGIEVATTDGRTHILGHNPTVRIEGRPGELLLFLAGRTAAAEVHVTGDETDLSNLHLAV